MKRWLKPHLLVWLALAALLGWTLHSVSAPQISASLSKLNLAQIAMLAVLNCGIFLLFASRWWLLLRVQESRVPFLALARYRLAGFAISYFTPGAQFGGEPLQVLLLQRRHAVPGALALAAVSLDKAFEVLANFIFLAVGVLLTLSAGAADVHRFQSLALVAGLLALPLVYLAALWAGRLPIGRLAKRLPKKLAGWRRLNEAQALMVTVELQIGALFRRRPQLILGMLLLSGAIWALMLGEYWLMMNFLGFQMNFLQTMSAMTATRLAFLTPLPGGAGALEASQALAMQALGAPAALGLSASLLIRARDLSFGLPGLWLAGVYGGAKTNIAASPELGEPLASPLAIRMKNC